MSMAVKRGPYLMQAGFRSNEFFHNGEVLQSYSSGSSACSLLNLFRYTKIQD
jgi:hypothetical protein